MPNTTARQGYDQNSRKAKSSKDSSSRKGEGNKRRKKGEPSAASSSTSAGQHQPAQALSSLLPTIRALQAKELARWTEADLSTWLQLLQLGEYTKLFHDEAITGTELLRLGKKDLMELGMKLGHRLRFQRKASLLEKYTKACSSSDKQQFVEAFYLTEEEWNMLHGGGQSPRGNMSSSASSVSSEEDDASMCSDTLSSTPMSLTSSPASSAPGSSNNLSSSPSLPPSFSSVHQLNDEQKATIAKQCEKAMKGRVAIKCVYDEDGDDEQDISILRVSPKITFKEFAKLVEKQYQCRMRILLIVQKKKREITDQQQFKTFLRSCANSETKTSFKVFLQKE
ncbi:hypothetical protein QOT17_017407 [Balamuthia mandrillaris]